MVTPGVAPAPWFAERVTVWQHRRFRLFWTGDTISALGAALSLVAIPLLALQTLNASDATVGLLRAAQTLPFLLLAVPIGLLADRISRRHLLLAADVVRFPLVALIAILGPSLPVPGLTLLVFLIGAGTVAYEVAYLSALPDLVATPAELPTANQAVETAHATATLLGPAAAGTLIAATTTPTTAIALNALTFLLSAVLLTLNRPSHPRERRISPNVVRRLLPVGERRLPPGVVRRLSRARRMSLSVVRRLLPDGAQRGPTRAVRRCSVDGARRGPNGGGALSVPGRGEVPGSAGERRPGRARALVAGWTWLWRDRYVRPMTLYLAANNFAAQAFQTALLLFVVRTLGLSAAAAGFAVAAAGAGFLAGATVSPAAARRLGTGPILVAAAVLGGLGIATVAAAPGLPVVLVGAAVSGAGPGLLNLHSISIRQTITPPSLLGRVNAVVKTVSYGSTALGSLTGGIAAAASSPRAVIAFAAAGSLLASTILATSALRTLTTAKPHSPAA